MTNIAVIDTETNWSNKIMSIGLVIADNDTFLPIISKYYIITPEKSEGGMFSHVLYHKKAKVDLECSRKKVLEDLKLCILKYTIKDIFAYNASFDYHHLPELSYLSWYDIMSLAAYKQHNTKIPNNADCFNTGRLKRGYGVENMYRILSGNHQYYETHNAVFDAFDELKIMALLNHKIADYKRI